MSGDVLTEPARAAGSADFALTEIIKRRGVRRLVYFHCDHFEPWRVAPGSRTIEENAADVLEFAERSAANEASRRLTLFYKVHVGVTRNLGSPGVVALAPDDVFGFAPRTAAQEATFGGAMRGLLDRVRHEVQVHIHHEHHTYNSSHKDPVVIEQFRRPEVRARDSARFELGLELSLDAIRRETGLDLRRWFFVHGVWALNASDPAVCHVTDEIEVLMRHGCLGDFTFPAGRPNVDPILEVPHFVRPWNAPQGYVLPEAEPELALGNAAAARSKFFLWASDIRHTGSSIDYFAQHVRQRLEDPGAFAAEILERSYVADGTLYFKTHCHSMHALYRPDGAPMIFPHQHREVQALLGTVFDAADAARAEIAFLTASEVYDEFVRSRPAPQDGFGLKVPFGLLSSAAATPVLDGAKSPPPLPFVDEVNALSTEVLREALDLGGPMAPGVGEYYQRRAERGEVLAPYEVRIARALLQEGPFDAVFEIGSGVSALPLLMALNGVKSIGIERDTPRADLGRVMLERLAVQHPGLESLCEIRRASAPEALRHENGAACAAVFTNITSPTTIEDFDEIIALMAGFGAVVVDLSRFFEVRDKAEQAELLDRFVRAGWARPAPLATPGDTYWMFRRNVDFDPHDD